MKKRRASLLDFGFYMILCGYLYRTIYFYTIEGFIRFVIMKIVIGPIKNDS